MAIPPGPDHAPHDPLEGLDPDEIRALARAAVTGALGGPALGRGGPGRAPIPDLDDVIHSELYEGLYAPVAPLSVVAGNIVRGLLARAEHDDRYEPDLILTEPSVELRRKDNTRVQPWVGATGERVEPVNRGRDMRLEYTGREPGVVGQGWRIASWQPVQEHRYQQPQNREVGQQTNHSPMKEVGLMLDTDGNVRMYCIPKLAARPTEGTGRYDADGREIQRPVGDQQYSDHLRGLNPHQPHIMRPDQVQVYHFPGTTDGIVPVGVLGTIPGNELIDQLTEVATGGGRRLETILYDFADRTGVDPLP